MQGARDESNRSKPMELVPMTLDAHTYFDVKQRFYFVKYARAHRFLVQHEQVSARRWHINDGAPFVRAKHFVGYRCRREATVKEVTRAL